MNSEKELLAIRFSSLGDVAMLVPVFISFHAEYPHKLIKFISRERFRPIFSQLDFIEFISIDKNDHNLSLWTIVKYYFSNPKSNFIVLDFHDVIRSRVLSFMYKLSGCQIFRIDKGRAEKRKIIEFKEKKIVQLKTSIERYSELFYQAGYKFELTKSAFLESQIKSDSEIRIGIAPFAKHSSKELTADKLKSILEEISKIENVKIYILGNGKNERKKAEFLIENIPNSENIIDQMDFESELNFISQLDIMLSMDSGNGHLASNYGIPVITIWGTTHPYLGFSPYSQPSNYSIFPDHLKYPYLPTSIFGKNKVKEYERAIDSIDSRKVIDLIQNIISIKAS